MTENLSLLLAKAGQKVLEPRRDVVRPSTISRMGEMVAERAKTNDAWSPDAAWKHQRDEQQKQGLDLLRQFARDQITSFVGAVASDQASLERYLAYLDAEHPFDSIMRLFSAEPMLMLTNLTRDQVVILYQLLCQLYEYEGNNAQVLESVRMYIMGAFTLVLEATATDIPPASATAS